MDKIKENTNPNKIIIFIMGTSAVGKTKLSLEIADKLKNCEIINCDSMQIYKEADIMTAKATKEERNKIKHHLLDVLDISMKEFNRNNYMDLAIPLIETLFNAGTIPIIVGGTHYYIESLLFRDNEMFEEEEADYKDKNCEEINKLEDYKLLQQIDPVIASKIHCNDKRKIRNYLNLYNKYKKLPSELVKSYEFDKTLRYENAIVFWPYMKNIEVLKQKARLRIEEMVNNEGIKEIISVYENFCKEAKEVENLDKTLDFQRGVLQAIGYKEFFPFYKEVKKLLIKLNLSYEKVISNEQELEDLLLYIKDDDELQKNLKECKEKLLMKTMKYTKKQLVWIENRLCNFKILQQRIFKLEFESYNGDEFNQKVLMPACDIMLGFYLKVDHNELAENYKNFLIKNENKNNMKRFSLEEWKKFYCEICDYELNGPKEWEIHLKSKKHSRKKTKIDNEKNEKKLNNTKNQMKSEINEEEKK